MEPSVPVDSRHDAAPLPFPEPPRDTSRDDIAAPPAAAVPRHLYTMTVDRVAAELYTYQLYRDVRTIQRWCKSGKLRAIIDEEQGERYLIDPASVRDMVATLLAERDAQARHTPPSRQESRPPHDAVAAPRATPDTAATTSSFGQQAHADTEPHAATKAATGGATADPSRDDVAALQRRVEGLEKERAMLMVDKQVREQLVDFMKEKFDGMLDEALNRTEELGRLRAENAHLRALLPAPAPQVEEPYRFTPKSISRPVEEPLHNPAPWAGGEGV